MLRGLLNGTPETVQDLLFAADERFFDGFELVIQGRYFGGVYCMGYTAEMLLKAATFLADGARPNDFVSAKFGAARRFAKVSGIDPEHFHSLFFWASYLIDRRQFNGNAMSPNVRIEMDACIRNITASWLVEMRYRSSASDPLLEAASVQSAAPVYESVDWLRSNFGRLWR
jgi:hypothetical protein